MLPDRVSDPGPLTYESDALPIALRGPVVNIVVRVRTTCTSIRAPDKRVHLGYFNFFLFLNFSYFSTKTYSVTSH